MSASTLLTCGRLTVRAVFTCGLQSSHAACVLEAIDGPSKVNSANQLRRDSTINNDTLQKFPIRRKSSSSSAPPAPNEKAPTNCARKFIAGCCGFPKDLVNGPSFVLDRGVFGDDACFISRHKSADVVGVADGVGGWRQYGIDPSNFSRTLMQTCAKLVESGQFEPSQPARLLAAAYKQLYISRRKSSHLIGSSTACVVALERSTSRLYTANLGDSGFVVVRNGRVLSKSEEQTHYFNAPFQLALPPNIDERDGFLGDSPDMADTSSFVAEEGDLILLATDGVFDNLPVELIEKELAKLQIEDCGLTEEKLQAACNSLALQARRLAYDQSHVSPFALKAHEHGIHAPGGKPDDITLVLVMVTTQ